MIREFIHSAGADISNILNFEKDYKDMAKDTYYFDDLVGCKILDDNNQELGIVSQVEEFPAQLTLRVKRANDNDFLVPFVKAFIKQVDIENKKIFINVIGGLLWK